MDITIGKILLKCSVTSIHHHEMQDLDSVQCAVLVQT